MFNDSFLFVFRILFACAWIYTEVRQWMQWDNSVLLPLRQYTNWTYYTIGIWLTCILYCQYQYGVKKVTAPSDSDSYTQFWKVCSVLFVLITFHSIMVTGLYWGLLAPSQPDKEVKDYDLYKHAMPFAFLTGELLMNNIVIEKRHLAPVMIFIALYLGVLVGYTTTGDRYIYPILKFEDSSSWILAFSILAVVPIIYALLWFISAVKFNLIGSTVSS